MYGLYLYRSSVPLFTGTRAQCRDQVNALSDAERLHGWTIAPVPPEPEWPLNYNHSRNRYLWAVFGMGMICLVLLLAAMAFKSLILAG